MGKTFVEANIVLPRFYALLYLWLIIFILQIGWLFGVGWFLSPYKLKLPTVLVLMVVACTMLFHTYFTVFYYLTLCPGGGWTMVLNPWSLVTLWLIPYTFFWLLLGWVMIGRYIWDNLLWLQGLYSCPQYRFSFPLLPNWACNRDLDALW